jgi:hypothetical protein
MGATGTFYCPTNNQDSKTAAFFVSSKAEELIKCKPCSHSTATVTDKDPVAGKVWTSLSWGPLMKYDGAVTTFTEREVDGYYVYIVDTKGRKLPLYNPADLNAELKVYPSGYDDRFLAAKVDKVVSPTSCCTDGLYSVSISVTLPTGFDKFMVVPYQGKYALPMSLLSATIFDSSSGVAEKVTGSFTLAVSNIAEAKKSLKFRDACRAGLANTLPGVSKDDIRITDIKAAPAGGRRLGLGHLASRLEEASNRLASHRRLAAGSVVVEYEIILPESYAGPAIVATSISAATLKEKINKAVVDSGAGITVTAVSNIAAPTTTSVGTPGASGGARRTAELFASLTLVAIAAALRMFC